MKISFYVFSGTGNTLKVCEYFKEKIGEKGADARLVSLRADKQTFEEKEILNSDEIIIGYPIHAFNAPKPIYDFVLSLPDISEKNNTKAVYFIKTSGEPLALNDVSSLRAARVLTKKGYKVCGEFHYVMPYNIIFKHSDKMAARMWRDAKLKMDTDVSTIIDKNCFSLNKACFKRLISGVLRIEQPGIRLIGKAFKATDKCIGCGKCADNCSASNIKIENGRAVFGKNCVGCMACAFYCPVDAVKIGILNGWRVNGKYDFSAEPADDTEVCNFLKKKYIKYFDNIENK